MFDLHFSSTIFLRISDLDAVPDRATKNVARTAIDRAAEVDPPTVSEAVRSIRSTEVEAVLVKKRKSECANRGKSRNRRLKMVEAVAPLAPSAPAPRKMIKNRANVDIRTLTIENDLNLCKTVLFVFFVHFSLIYPLMYCIFMYCIQLFNR